MKLIFIVTTTSIITSVACATPKFTLSVDNSEIILSTRRGDKVYIEENRCFRNRSESRYDHRLPICKLRADKNNYLSHVIINNKKVKRPSGLSAHMFLKRIIDEEECRLPKQVICSVSEKNKMASEYCPSYKAYDTKFNGIRIGTFSEKFSCYYSSLTPSRRHYGSVKAHQKAEELLQLFEGVCTRTTVD